jgi:hypothetical protein
MALKDNKKLWLIVLVILVALGALFLMLTGIRLPKYPFPHLIILYVAFILIRRPLPIDKKWVSPLILSLILSATVVYNYVSVRISPGLEAFVYVYVTLVSLIALVISMIWLIVDIILSRKVKKV